MRPHLHMLEPADVETLVSQACQVLDRVGVLVEHQDATGLLLEAGARLSGGRVHLSEDLVRSAVATAPGRVCLYDTAGELAADLGGDRVHFDPGSAALHVYELVGGRRLATSSDLVDLARLVDGLDNFAVQSTALVPSDIPGDVADRFRLYASLLHGRKPVITGTFKTDAFGPMREMLLAVRGTDAALRERPLAVFDCCPSPPLKWSALTCQALLDCARSGVPAELISMPLTGATSLVTLREAVLQHTAESLSGLVIHQLAGPGSPIVYGGAPSAFDMRHGSTPMGAMETMMIVASYAQVGKHLGLPVHGYLALSDSKVPDYQAGMETGMGAVMAALAGVNMVSGPGILDYILTLSPEKLLLDHEAAGLALRLTRGVESRGGDVVGLIGELVAKGDFLGHAHTRKHWRAELSVTSPLIDRAAYPDWEAAGGRWAHERAATAARARLDAAAGEPPPYAHALREIMGAELARHGAELPG